MRCVCVCVCLCLDRGAGREGKAWERLCAWEPDLFCFWFHWGERGSESESEWCHDIVLALFLLHYNLASICGVALGLNALRWDFYILFIGSGTHSHDHNQNTCLIRMADGCGTSLGRGRLGACPGWDDLPRILIPRTT